MATIAYTSAAWLLLIVGSAILGNIDDNGSKWAIILWFGAAIAACLYGAAHYAC